MADANNNVEAPPEGPAVIPQEPNANQDGRRNMRRVNNNFASANTALRQFRGETPSIDAVLSLSTERIDKSVPFEIFQEKIKNYVLKELKRGEDIVSLVTDLKNPMEEFNTEHSPTDPTEEEEKSHFKMKMWELRAKRFLDREETLGQNVFKIYALVIGQCSPALKSALKGDAEYTKKSASFDALWLLKKLKVISSGVDVKANPTLTLYEQAILFFDTRQGTTESDDDYLVRFNSRCKNLELAGGGHFFCSAAILASEFDDASEENIEKTKEKFKAMCFLQKAHPGRYRDLIEDLKKAVHRGRDEYPATRSDAYDLLARTSGQDEYENVRTYRNGRGNYRRNTRNFSFAQNERENGEADQAPVPGRDGVLHEAVRCYACRKMGHYAGKCTNIQNRDE